MKKSVLISLILFFIITIFCIPCFAADTIQVVTFSCDTTSNLTKKIILETTSNVTIEWGDTKKDEIVAVVGDSGAAVIEKSHTYTSAGQYEVKVSASGIKRLEISNNDIFEINLTQATSLEALDISNNKLNSLSMSNNGLLSSLLCSNNYLSELDLSVTGVNKVDCSNNILETLKVPNTVVELYVRSNKLKGINGSESFDLDGFNQLNILECSDNNISSLIINDSSFLTKLDCSNNFIEEISLKNNKQIVEIYCNGNNLKTLDLSANTLLQTLNCSGNKITTLNINKNIKLEKLYAFDNNISNISLNNINIGLVILDNINVSDSAALTLVKIEISGNGGVFVNSNNAIMFSDVPESLKINNVNETPKQTISINNYNGTYTIIASFPENLVSSSTVNAPQLLDGMIPVKHNGVNWVITNASDKEWYDYSKSNMKWANVMLRDGAQYLDLDGKTLKNVGNISLSELNGREVPESSTGSMYVWIPRFSYKTNNSNIEITYSSGLTDFAEDGYKVHPAFNYANYLGGEDTLDKNNYVSLETSDKYLGLWVAKYQAGQSIDAPKYSLAASSINNVSIGDAFLASKLTTTLQSYRLNEGISHMMKNSEWGAIAYFTTAIGKLENNSTTGNVYGIYDLENSAEYVSSFIELVGGISNVSVRKNGRSLLPYTIISYNNSQVADVRDIEILRLKSAEDSSSSNYNILASFYGNGVKEVSSIITGTITANAPSGNNAFLVRGIDGIYSYSGSTGASDSNIGFRNVIVGIKMSNSNKRTYTIRSSSNEGGIISPKGNTVVFEGDNITYSIIPDAGSEIIDVIVDGKSVYYELDSYSSYFTYSFENVNNNHEISVTFNSEVVPYEVIVEKNIEEAGTVIGAGIYNSRSTVTLQVVTNEGYKFLRWVPLENLDAIPNPTSRVTSFTMPSGNVRIRADFEKSESANLTIENIYGKMSMEKSIGEAFTVDACKQDGFVFVEWLENGLGLTDEQRLKSSLELIMPANDVTLIANYNKLYPLEILLGDGTKLSVGYQETKQVMLSTPFNIDDLTFSNWTLLGLPTESFGETDLSFYMPSNAVKMTINYHM